MKSVEFLTLEEAACLKEEARAFLASSTELALEELVRRNWVATPVSEPMSDSQAAHLARATGTAGFDEAFAVITLDDTPPEAFRVSLTATGFKEMQAEALLRPYLLRPQNSEFVVLNEGDYFFVVAGDEAFVSTAVGNPLNVAHRLFETEIRRMKYPDRTREWLLKTGRRYASS